MRLILITYLFCVFHFCNYAGVINIKGIAHKSYVGQTIKVTTYADYISEKTLELTTSEISAKGEFSITFNSESTVYTMLRIQNCQATLYTEPGKSYIIGIFQKDSAEIETLANYTPIELRFFNSDSLELNYLIYDFLEKLDKFMEKFQGSKMADNNILAAKTDTFYKKIKARYKHISNAYFQNYIEYTIAALQLNFINELTIYNKFIKNKSILYNHREYMNFLKTFLGRIISGVVENAEMKKEIEDTQNFESFNAFFSKSKIMLNDSLREVSMLYSLRLCFSSPLYKRERVIEMISQCEQHMKSVTHKEIASNLSRLLSKMMVGAEIMNFDFYDINNKKVSLSDFKGKYIYLAFIKTYCKTCEEEIKVSAEHQKKYGSKVEFVYIFLENSNNKTKDAIKMYPKQGINYLFANDWMKIKEYFEIVAIPSYILISPEGKIKMYPALNPGLDMEKVFSELTKKK